MKRFFIGVIMMWGWFPCSVQNNKPSGSMRFGTVNIHDAIKHVNGTPYKSNQLIVYFTNHYKNDTVELFVNDSIKLKTKATTDESIGVAAEKDFYNFQSIKDIGISIDGIRKFTIGIMPQKHVIIIELDKAKKIIDVSFYDCIPLFD